jgi:transcriptional regulator with XRE-family HTH domain
MIKIRLKYWRQRRVMTIRELATKAGVSTQTIVSIENETSGEVRPSTLRKLAEALKIGLDELVVDGTPAKVA